jgi:NAD(P)-dependent dehydrogenase (short-subunit alcohol dehydrogenase family)
MSEKGEKSVELGLAGKVVVVTGGSDGLGRALGLGLVAEGARVALCGRDPGRLDATVADLEAAGGDALGVVADVARLEDLEALVGRTVTRWGRIDGVVNNAGHGTPPRPVVEVPDEAWSADLDLKVLAAVRLVRLAAPYLRVHGGSIVNVLAISGRTPGGNSTPSSVSRAAGLALTKALSRELGPDGIRVNAVLIGLVESGQWRRAAEAQDVTLADLYASMAADAGIPLGRVGHAGEFADLVSYLLSERSSYVNGTAINLDGGLSGVP